MSLFFRSHRNPSLPQDDSASAERREQLELARNQYVWDYNKENLNGIPMVQSVPVVQNFPSLKWVIKVFEIALRVFENSLADFPKAHVSAKNQSHCIWANLINIFFLLVRILFSPLRKAYLIWSNKNAPAAQQTGIGEHLRFFSAFSKAALLPMFMPNAKMVQRLSGLYHQFNDYLTAKVLDNQLQGFKGLFKTIPIPATANQLMDDDAFARFRLAGPNPMLLAGIAALPEKFPVTEAGYKSVMAGDSLAAALKEQRLYLLDYAELQSLADQPGSKLATASEPGIVSQVFAPIALFALSNDRKQFKAVAIQAYQTPATQAIVYATGDINAPNYWNWQTAKALVQNADANYHELLVHLARTHLLIEAFAIATPRYLAENHPLFLLLNSHLEGSLFINELAERFLVDKGGNVDEVFGADINAVQAAAGEDRLKLNFYDAMLPNDLKRRRVDDPALLTDYPYRDDGMLIWNAIHTWVKGYIDVYYQDDSTVQADIELAAWTGALITEGKVSGFKPIQTKAQLADVLTMIIYTASAQHAAVNFPQSTVMSYLPVFPGSVVGVTPVTGNTELSWFGVFPPLKVAQAQLDLFYLLGSVYYSRLGDYRRNRFPYCPVMTDARITQGGGPLAQFKADLKQIEQTIQQRNQTRPPYTFLLPSHIPASINI